MHYREIRPAAPLSHFVECFWTLESDGTPEPERAESILPDGCVELVLNFGSPFREVKFTGEEQRQPIHFLVGQMTRPMMIAPAGRVELIGIRFHPGGTFPFFRMPMHEVANQVVELAALSSDLEEELVPVVEGFSTMRSRIAALDKLLVQRIRACKHDSWLVPLAAGVVSVGGRISIDELARTAGISGRQLERRFLRDVGIGPKMFCRILRFQEVFRAVDRNDRDWASVAVECGYYDQAHLIRDFQQFARQTPAAVLNQAADLTEFFTRKHRMSEFSNTHD